MLTPAELYSKVEGLSPRYQTMYRMGVMVSVLVMMALGALLIGVLTALLAWQFVDADVSTDGLLGAVILPAMMAYMFVLAGLRRRYHPDDTLPRNMLVAAWRNAWAGQIVGFVVVAFSHFLGQLVMARALYGALEFQTQVTSYCGLMPVAYGLLFAVPVALGCALYGAYVAVSDEVVYHAVARLEPSNDPSAA